MSKEFVIAGSTSSSAQAYDPAFFKSLVEVEDRHFWFRARNLIIAEIVSRLTAGWPPGFHVLEIGCGTGNVLRFLEKVCQRAVLVGMDLHIEGLTYAQQRTTSSLVVGDICHSPFGTSFDLVCMFDVIEHLADDEAVLRHAANMIRLHGVLLLTVPAHQALWSSFDEAAHHRRRYTLPELKRKLELAGFEVTFISEFMAAILPLVWWTRRVTARSEAAKKSLVMRQLRVIPLLNEILFRILSFEASWLGRDRRLPFGTSIVALAKKR